MLSQAPCAWDQDQRISSPQTFKVLTFFVLPELPINFVNPSCLCHPLRFLQWPNHSPPSPKLPTVTTITSKSVQLALTLLVLFPIFRRQEKQGKRILGKEVDTGHFYHLPNSSLHHPSYISKDAGREPGNSVDAGWSQKKVNKGSGGQRRAAPDVAILTYFGNCTGTLSNGHHGLMMSWPILGDGQEECVTGDSPRSLDNSSSIYDGRSIFR